MEPFTQLSAVAVPIGLPNLDTDQIVPARFLRHPRSTGYARFLFHDLRFRGDGSENPSFALNHPAYRAAQIVVAGENFGCGSSREGAAWALADSGFRALIAPSFGDIFFENSIRNGLLPVVLPEAVVERLQAQLREQPGGAITVDLPAQRLRGVDGTTHAFEIDPFSKECLLVGRDEIEMTLAHEPAISAFEAQRAAERPWLGTPPTDRRA